MILSDRQLREIRAIVDGRVLMEVPLSRFTSFRIGGPADLVIEPVGKEKLAEALRYLAAEGIPRMILGAGTNVLFNDQGFRGVVVRMAHITGLEFHDNGSGKVRVAAAAGVSLPAVVSRSCKLGWTGLESLWGIPGSFGGAIVTNAGAGAVSVADKLVSIRLLAEHGEEIILGKEDLIRGYRFLRLPEKAVVVEGALELIRGVQASIDDGLNAARALRRDQQPWDKPSAGCVFKNPSPENPAGAIIDRLGFKGRAVGDAEVSRVHANFIINRGSAHCADVLELIHIIRAKVKQEKGIDLELEIQVVGEDISRV